MSHQYPEKPAPTSIAINSLIARRWSPLAFSQEPIEQEKIDTLFEAARWAPSSFNEQPWRFIYTTKENEEEYSKLAELLTDGNSWAKNAFMLLLICTIPTFSRNDKPNKHNRYDAGAATYSLFLQAVDLGLVAHEMAGFDADAAHKALSIPKEVTALTMMAIGYPGDPQELSEELQKRQSAQRSRKEQSEIVFKGGWKA